MNSTVQLISFLVSFIYGIIFYLLTRFNKYIIENRKIVFRFIITLIFIIDIAILYIYIIYRINHGYFHIYFIFTVIIGFIVTHVFYGKIKNLVVAPSIFRHGKRGGFSIASHCSLKIEYTAKPLLPICCWRNRQAT